MRLAAILIALLPLAAAARAPGEVCLAAARDAAARHGVPERVLAAIGRVESGKRVDGRHVPWPWTLNVAGRGAWFGTRAEARAAAEDALAAGTTLVDIGCFQVNHHWHGAAFESVDAMLDPATNADYAARFLAGLRQEAGDWMRAAGWYHSRTPQHAARYRRLVAAALEAPPPPPRVAVARPPATGIARAPLPARRPRPLLGPTVMPGAVALSTLTGARGVLIGKARR